MPRRNRVDRRRTPQARKAIREFAKLVEAVQAEQEERAQDSDNVR